MENVFRHQTSTSIEEDLVPFLSSCLATSGWALVKIEPSKQIETDMLAIAVLCGHRFGRSLGYYILESEGNPNHLEAHSEGISNTCGITPYFALGCIQPSDTGAKPEYLTHTQRQGSCVWIID